MEGGRGDGRGGGGGVHGDGHYTSVSRLFSLKGYQLSKLLITHEELACKISADSDRIPKSRRNWHMPL